MATKGDETRARLIEATRTLVEAKGFHGAGLNEVLAVAGAPRGSLYHHFPGGKDQLVGEALAAAGREVDTLLDGLSGTSSEVVLGLLDALASRMAEAGYAKGCPLATVALEVAASNESLRRVCDGIYAGWQRRLADALRADGHEDADDLAATVLALIEGALVLARAGHSLLPVERAGRHLAKLLA